MIQLLDGADPDSFIIRRVSLFDDKGLCGCSGPQYSKLTSYLRAGLAEWLSLRVEQYPSAMSRAMNARGTMMALRRSASCMSTTCLFNRMW